VAHSLPPYGGARYLNTALVTYNTTIADVLILSTVTLPITCRPEDGLAEQAVLLWTQAAIIDRLRLRDLSIGPGKDLFRRGEADTQSDKVTCTVKSFVSLVIHSTLHGGRPGDHDRHAQTKRLRRPQRFAGTVALS
jgi:hypothetical protein